MLKFALAGMLLGALTAWLGDFATTVVLFGSAAALLTGLWRKVIAPLVRLSDRLAGLPAWMTKVDGDLERGHEHFETLEARLAALEEPAQVAAEKATAVARELDVPSRGA